MGIETMLEKVDVGDSVDVLVDVKMAGVPLTLVVDVTVEDACCEAPFSVGVGAFDVVPPPVPEPCVLEGEADFPVLDEGWPEGDGLLVGDDEDEFPSAGFPGFWPFGGSSGFVVGVVWGSLVAIELSWERERVLVDAEDEWELEARARESVISGCTEPEKEDEEAVLVLPLAVVDWGREEEIPDGESLDRLIDIAELPDGPGKLLPGNWESLIRGSGTLRPACQNQRWE
jgi:hypothetical protein